MFCVCVIIWYQSLSDHTQEPCQILWNYDYDVFQIMIEIPLEMFYMDLREEDMLIICYFHRVIPSVQKMMQKVHLLVIADRNLKETLKAFGFRLAETVNTGKLQIMFYLLYISTQSLICQLPEIIS